MTILDAISYLGKLGAYTTAMGYSGAGLKLAGDIIDKVEKNIPVLNNLIENAQLPSFGQSITPFGNIQYWDFLYKKVKDVNQDLGIAGSYSKIIEKNTLDAYKNIVQYGGEVEDITASYKELSTKYGRTLSLSTQDLTQLSKLRLMFDEGYADIFEMQQQVGRGITDSASMIEQTMEDAMQVGVISRNALNNLSDNIKLLDQYSFRRGTKALSEMAVYAERTRISIESAAKTSNTFRELDTGLEALAKLQLLGGDFARQFGDIFQLSYEARNEPEKLQKRLFEITKSLATIDRQTGEIKIDPYSFDLARNAAEALGINVEELAQAARVAAKEGAISNLFSVDIKTRRDFQEISQMVAGMAELKDGQWQIKIGNEVKTIAEIDQSDLETIQTYNEDQEDLMRQVIETNRSVSESLKAFILTIQRNLIPDEFYNLADTELKQILLNADNEILKSAFFEQIKVGLDAMSATAVDNLQNLGKQASESYKTGDFSKLWQAMMDNWDVQKQKNLFESNELSSFNRFQSQMMGYGESGFSPLLNLETKANDFFDKGIRAFDKMNSVLYLINPLDWKFDDWKIFFKSDKEKQMISFENQTKSYISSLTNSQLLNNVDSDRSGKISFEEFKGKIIVELPGGDKLGEVESKELWKKMAPMIENLIAEKSKFEIHKEMRSNTIQSGGGRTKDSMHRN